MNNYLELFPADIIYSLIPYFDISSLDTILRIPIRVPQATKIIIKEKILSLKANEINDFINRSPCVFNFVGLSQCIEDYIKSTWGTYNLTGMWQRDISIANVKSYSFYILPLLKKYYNLRLLGKHEIDNFLGYNYLEISRGQSGIDFYYQESTNEISIIAINMIFCKYYNTRKKMQYLYSVPCGSPSLPRMDNRIAARDFREGIYNYMGETLSTYMTIYHPEYLLYERSTINRIFTQSLHLRNRNGLTALEVAIKIGDFDCAKRLLYLSMISSYFTFDLYLVILRDHNLLNKYREHILGVASLILLGPQTQRLIHEFFS